DHPHLHSFPTRRSSDLRTSSASAWCQSITAELLARALMPDMMALPASWAAADATARCCSVMLAVSSRSLCRNSPNATIVRGPIRSEEHTSELQSRGHLV